MDPREESGRQKVNLPLLNGILALRPGKLIALTLVAGPFLLMLPPGNRLRRWIARKTVDWIHEKLPGAKQEVLRTGRRTLAVESSGSRTPEAAARPSAETILR